jgi:hypothetical protein
MSKAAIAENTAAVFVIVMRCRRAATYPCRRMPNLSCRQARSRVTSTLTGGLGLALSAADTDLKPRNGAITPPKPNSDAVSSGASPDAGPTSSADHVLSIKAVIARLC